MRLPSSSLIALAGCIFIGISARAQQPAPNASLLDHLAGNWILQGTVDGEETTHDMTATWVMNHEYLLIHEVSRETQPDGTPGYEAAIFLQWDPAASRYTCVWLDGSGVSPSSFAGAKPSGDEIPFTFPEKDSVNHTTFAYDASTDSWEVRVDFEQNGVTAPFARAKLIRQH